MAATSKTWPGNIPDSDIDPDSPLTTGLMTDIRDSLTNLAERIGDPGTYDENSTNHVHDGVSSDFVLPPNLYGDGSDGDVVSSGSISINKLQFYNTLNIQVGHSFTAIGTSIVRVKGNLTLNGQLVAAPQGGPWGIGPAQIAGSGASGVGSISVHPWTTGGVGGTAGVGPNGNGGGGGGAGAAANGGAGGQGAASSPGGAGGASPLSGITGFWSHPQFRDLYRLRGYISWAMGAGGGAGASLLGGANGGDGGNGGGILLVFVGGNITGAGTFAATGTNGGSSTDGGGGGGGGGGIIVILCGGSISGTGMAADVRGGAGGAGGGANVSGGGGGGGGGCLVVVSNVATAGLTGLVTGGAGGAAGGAGGTAGTAGTTGVIESVILPPEILF